MEHKFLIISPSNYDILSLVNNIEIKNDNVLVSNKFSNDPIYIDNDYNKTYYLDNTTINMAIKNNAILFAVSNVNIITGVTIDDFYNSNIIPMTYNEFNNISTNLLLKYIDNITIIWIDTKQHLDNKVLKSDIREVNYITNKINEHNFKYIYFLDEDVEVMSDVILSYLNGDETTKSTILKEYC